MNSSLIKKIIKSNKLSYRSFFICNMVFSKLIERLIPIRGNHNYIQNNGLMVYCNKTIFGDDNILKIGKGSRLNNVTIRIRGNRNRLIIDNNVLIGGGSLWIEGNDNSIIIHKGTTFTRMVHLNAQEHKTNIEIGEDCMFSNSIIVRTSDSHPIYNSNNVRINEARSVSIGNHVWIAPNSTIMKGVVIGDNCIIGSNTLVTKNIPNNCLAVGIPAHVVKEDIHWTREDVIFSRF